MFHVGQGLFGRFKFTDGNMPQYDRAYLIIEVSPDKIGILNVSSVPGKEHKLLFPTNKLINKHFPPFLRKSFVKLDSLVHISNAEANGAMLLEQGRQLDQAEFNGILNALKNM